MTRQLILVNIFLLILFQIVLFSQTITGIEIKGADNFSVNDYLNWINIPDNSAAYAGITDTVKNRIGNELFARGYYNYSFLGSEFVDSEDSGKVELELTIDEGTPTYINQINFANADSIDSLEILPDFEFLTGKIFVTSELELQINRALDYFEDYGYPFASIIIESLNFYYDSTDENYYVNINLVLNKQQVSRIDDVEITGNTKTKDFVIIRNIRLNKGEYYSQSRINDIPKKLNRLRFFEPVNTPDYYLNSKGEGILHISVVEKETNNFDGIVGYVPGKDDEKGFFTGFVNISLRNLFGTERAAAFRWKQEDRYSQELELKYLEPWLAGFPVNILLGLYQRKQDTTYVQRRFDGSVEYLATEDISGSVLISTESTIPTESSTGNYKVFKSSILSTGLSLKIDTRDDIYAPTEGILLYNIYKFSSKKITGPDVLITPATKTKINLQRLEVDFKIFYEIFRRQVIALGVSGRELKGDLFEISDLYKLGGTNTLRGYRENQFLGNRILWSNFEYRYLLTQRSFAFLFFDSGYYLRNEDADRSIERSSGFKIGYGAGLSLETALGVLSVSYALAKGASFSDGLIHFGILNEF